MIKNLKKSFTLIELIVSILIGTILINFIFTFQFNFMKELEFLKAKERLAIESFKLAELLTRGFMITDDNDDFVSGIISLDDRDSDGTKYKSIMYPTKKVHYEHAEGKKYTKINDKKSKEKYTYKRILTNDSLSVMDVLDKDGNGENLNRGIYAIDFNSEIIPSYNNLIMNNPTYTNYQRLVYTK